MLTATSVNISWSQPEFSSPTYSVTLTGTAETDPESCAPASDAEQGEIVTGNSHLFSDLEEFQAYTVSVNATFIGLGSVLGYLNFTTPSNGEQEER